MKPLSPIPTPRRKDGRQASLDDLGDDLFFVIMEGARLWAERAKMEEMLWGESA